MNLTLDLPPEAVAAIVAEVREAVLAELRESSHASPASSPYLSIPEAAEYLRCSRQRVDNLLSARRLTRYKDGGRTLLSRAEIEAHLRGERVATLLPPARQSRSGSQAPRAPRT